MCECKHEKEVIEEDGNEEYKRLTGKEKVLKRLFKKNPILMSALFETIDNFEIEIQHVEAILLILEDRGLITVTK